MAAKRRRKSFDGGWSRYNGGLARWKSLVRIPAVESKRKRKTWNRKVVAPRRKRPFYCSSCLNMTNQSIEMREGEAKVFCQKCDGWMRALPEHKVVTLARKQLRPSRPKRKDRQRSRRSRRRR